MRNCKKKNFVQQPSYRIIPREDEEEDIEKQHGNSDEYSDDSHRSSTSSTYSQRSSSNFSNDLMLVSNSKKKLVKTRHLIRYTLPNRVARYLTFSIISILVVFILSLVRASIVSSRRIEAGNLGKRPPPPPEKWESFPFLTRYYGGIRTLTSSSENTPEYPIPEEETDYLQNNHTIPIQSLPTSKPFNAFTKDTSILKLDTSENFSPRQCYLDAEGTSLVPQLQYYQGRPQGFPENIVGSYELLGLPEDLCFERFGRLGPYGYGYATKYGGTGTGEDGDREGIDTVWKNGSAINQVDYRYINWADAQRRCYTANKARFEPIHSVKAHETTSLVLSRQSIENEAPEGNSNKTMPQIKLLVRSAVVIRAWDDFEYHEEDIINLRAMVSELSLGSGGEYDVHLLVQVKNEGANPIWADEETYQKHLNNSVPQEFRGITTLWSETQMLMLYQGIYDTFTRGPELPIHGPYRGLQMAIQYFAHKHPEYDFFWHWEIDTRYTGHYYHLFSQIESWAARQPRKGLWERSSRFYIPSVHGSWEDFKHMVRIQTEIGTHSPDKIWSSVKGSKTTPQVDKPIWGPERPNHREDWFEIENDPVPPTTYEKDKYQWGVGESADLITFNPLFDPEDTTWLLSKDITGYNISDGLPARRATIVTSSRMSKRLLQTMHRETTFKKHHAFSEMWAPTTALHHGYKAVYVPHPMFIDRKWPVDYLTGKINAGRNGATGGARTSVFGTGEHNLLGMTWYYNAGFGPNLWKRWLGLKVNNDGGPDFEMIIDESKGKSDDVSEMKGGEGRMCLPPILIHPVKNVRLPVDSTMIKEELPESDPSA